MTTYDKSRVKKVRYSDKKWDHPKAQCPQCKQTTTDKTGCGEPHAYICYMCGNKFG